MTNTIEELFQKFAMGNKEVLTLKFATNTSSYINYGEKIVLFVEFDDNEILHIMTNIRSGKKSYNYNLKGKLIESMQEVSIDLKDVIETTIHK